MSMSLPAVAAEIVHAWVRLYTSGLPAAIQSVRLAEVDSDLWEQQRDAIETGHRPWVTAIEITVRWLMGIPTDLSWRIDLFLTSRYGGQVNGLKSKSEGQTFICVAGLMAALTGALGVAVSLGMFESHIGGHDVPRVIWGIVGPSAGGIVLTGLSVGRRLPVLGDVFVIVGAFPLAAILVWTIFVPALWVLLVTFLVIRVLRFAWSNGAFSS